MAHIRESVLARPQAPREPVMDAALDLMALRKQLLAATDARGLPTRPDVEVVGVGLPKIRGWLARASPSHGELLGVHPVCTITPDTHEANRRLTTGGGRVVSMYHPGGTSRHLVPYLTDDLLGPTTYLTPVPVQMVILGRRAVVLEGPELGGDRSAIVTSTAEVLDAAWRYWTALHADAVLASAALGDDPLAQFTPRQREILTMLADDHTDRTIAARLDVSLRTVQYEVAAILRMLNVRSRFGAGLRLGELGITP
jgi:DNA-binding CsgD family transcriptional regulator